MSSMTIMTPVAPKASPDSMFRIKWPVPVTVTSVEKQPPPMTSHRIMAVTRSPSCSELIKPDQLNLR